MVGREVFYKGKWVNNYDFITKFDQEKINSMEYVPLYIEDHKIKLEDGSAQIYSVASFNLFSPTICDDVTKYAKFLYDEMRMRVQSNNYPKVFGFKIINKDGFEYYAVIDNSCSPLRSKFHMELAE